MTTNARDEKWSEWKPNHGTQPPHELVEVKFDDGSTDQDKPNMYYWPIDDDSSCDIIAYRYKIKEPESDMVWIGPTKEAETLNPELKALAETVEEWPKHKFAVDVTVDGRVVAKNWHDDGRWNEGHWIKARKCLGLVMSDEEEDIKADDWVGSVPVDELHDNVNKPKHYQLRGGTGRMNKQLENKVGHQKREILALQDKVKRLEKHCLELQHQNAEYKHANNRAFSILGGVK